jgi:3-hydroxyacyl-CoA dehydrogenase
VSNVNELQHITLIGTGLVGQGWAIVFARAGFRVTLYDNSSVALERAMAEISNRLEDLEQHGLLEWVEYIRPRIEIATDLETALHGAIYVQESVPEVLDLKREIFARLDALTDPDVILASSTSAIAASQFTESLAGRHRCLVAHPVNPPYLVPLVEIVPAPWTTPETVNRTQQLMNQAGQVPILVRHEVQGFILNRLQAALLNEAFRLVENGYASTEDVDKTLRDGLGLRWSFMGPFETIDLNAPGGVRDYVERYGQTLYEMAQSQAWPRRWSDELITAVETERRKLLPASGLASRRRWRDRRLMALLAHRRKVDQEVGD